MNHDFVYLFSRPGADASQAGERPLILSEAPEELRKQRDEAENELERFMDRARLPKGLNLLRLFSWPLVWLLVIAILKARTSLRAGYANAPGVFWVGGVALLIAGTLELIQRLKIWRMRKDAAFQETCRTLERAEDALHQALEIPEDTESLEILALSGKPGKDGAEISAPARNLAVVCFRQDGELCLYDGTRILVLPLAGAKLRTLEWGVPVDGSTWLRKDRPDSRKYRQYGVLCGNAGQIGLRFCCALEVWKDGQGYRLLVPAYELLKLALLTELDPPKLPGEGEEKSALSEKAEKGPVRPVFYWRFPRERAGFWATPHADVGFRAAHPKLYVLLVCLGLFVLLLPLIPMIFLIPAGTPANGWMILLGIGCLTAGTGLFNIVAAWMHQYLGHWFTLGCLVLGGLMMALGWMLML